jgi:hypothetical protein
MVGEDQRRQFKQIVQIAKRYNEEETEILINNYPGQWQIRFHVSKDDSQEVLRA